MTQMKIANKKENQQNIDIILPFLQRLSDENYRIINTELSDLKTVAEKRRRYISDLKNHKMAMLPGGAMVSLGSNGATFNEVDLLGGIWRVQKPFDARGYEMVEIYDNKNNKNLRFVLLKQLDRQEHTNFVYYSAASVGWGAFGLNSDFEPDYIIAKYDTNRGLFYSYRCVLTDKDALANARAHLAGKVLAVYQDLIDAEIQKSRIQQNNALLFSNVFDKIYQ